MSDNSLPLPVDILAIALAGSRPELDLNAESYSDEQLSEFSSMLASELGQAEAPPATLPVEATEGLPAVQPLPESGKDLPPPSGMPLPLTRAPSVEGASRSDAVPATDAVPVSPLPPTTVLPQKPANLSSGLSNTAAPESPQPPLDATRPLSTSASPEILPPVHTADPEPRLDGRLADSTEVPSTRVPEQVTGSQGDVRVALGAEPPKTASPERQSFQLAEPMHTPRWGEGLANRVTWMANHDVQQAELRLNPPRLGPLEVRIAVTNDETSVTFTAQHAPVREALEAALPRLRELMAANGLNLVQVDVGQHSSGGGHQQSAEPGLGRWSPAYASSQSQDDGPLRGAAGSAHEGLVDAFA